MLPVSCRLCNSILNAKGGTLKLELNASSASSSGESLALLDAIVAGSGQAAAAAGQLLRRGAAF